MQHDDLVLFLGPTLRLDEARELLDANYCPPASRGDVYRVSCSSPRAIVIIDGAFEDRAAVLHNEILWALSQGIHVFGASSMGALRAAELARFGMVGRGRIFESYRDGLLERDDAVSVVHGPAELGYPQLSVALVDIYATLEDALRRSVVTSDEQILLNKVAEMTFYKRRSLEGVLERAGELGLASNRVVTLRDQLPRIAVSQKRLDALALLTELASCERVLAAPFVPGFRFEWTAAWDSLKAEVDGELLHSADRDSAVTVDEFSEFALTSVQVEAIGLLLAEQEARRNGRLFGEVDIAEAGRAFRSRRGLRAPADVRRWMEDGGLEHASYVAMVEEEFYLDVAKRNQGRRLRGAIQRVLRRRRNTPGRPSLSDTGGDSEVTS
jgi:hypothetical protein